MSKDRRHSEQMGTLHHSKDFCADNLHWHKHLRAAGDASYLPRQWTRTETADLTLTVKIY